MESKPELNALPGGAVYVKPGFFSQAAAGLVRQGLTSAKPAAGIILDLRDASGGFADTTTEILQQSTGASRADLVAAARSLR